MPYGTIKVDNIVFTNSGVDQTIGVSGLVQSVSGNLTATGTISGNLIRGNTVSGATITGSVLSVTSGLFTSGTVSAPTIGFAGDGNTGFWTPAGDTVALSTGGSERIRVDADGDLGVGTTSPTSRLTVRADAASGPNTIIRVENRAASAGATTQNIKIEGIFDYNNGTSDASAGAIVFGKQGTYTTATTANDSYLAFETVTDNSSTEKLRINSTGQLITTISGTAAAPAIVLGNDVNSGLYSPGADQVAISTGGTGRLFVNSDGSIQFGNPAATRLQVAAVTGMGDSLYSYSSNYYIWGLRNEINDLAIESAFGGNIIFRAKNDGVSSSPGAATERLRITSAGRLLIGHDTARQQVALEIQGVTSATSFLSITRNQNNANPAAIGLYKSRGTANNTYTAVQSGDQLGLVLFSGTDGTQDVISCSVYGIVEGTPSAGIVPGVLAFHTSNAAGSLAERARITSAGNVGIGASLAPGGFDSRVWIDQAGTNDYGLLINASGGVKQPTLWLREASATLPGKIVGQSGLTLATTSSATAALTIDGSQRVGIGTSSPNTLLDVNGAITANGDGAIRDTGTASTVYLDLATGSASHGEFVIRSSNAVTERMRITSAGNVGIGTSSPSTTLDCKGNITLGAQNSAAANLQPTAGSGTNIAGSHLILRAGQPTGNGASGQVQIFPSTSSVNSGTAARNNASKGLYLRHQITLWDDNSSLFMLNAVFGSSASEGNRSNLGNDGCVVTIDGANNGSQSALEIVGSSNGSGGRQGFIRFFGSSSKNPYATLAANTNGIEYTSGQFTINTYNLGVEGEVARFTHDGKVLIGTTTSTANGGVLQISNGITFPGTQSACSDANTLDDYEEGTFTPTIVGTTLAGTGTYAAQQAKYTKIGRIVYIQARIDWTAHTGTGAMRISGLPFAVSSSASTPAISIIPDRMTSPASTFPQAYALNSTSDIVIVSTTIAGGGEANLAMDTNAGIRVGGWYEV
jgi:hypothetical protein